VDKPGGNTQSRGHEFCPHCGTPLSPWEKVLLSVDRALMCKHCWYRILLDTKQDVEKPKKGRK
jgi:DNA-directed RNA polymerase subunit RPC12/RpoP